MAKSLKLTLNIGVPDARRLGLKETQAGKVVSVEDEAAEEMLSRGWAVEPDKDTLDPSAKPSTSATPKVGEGDKGHGK